MYTYFKNSLSETPSVGVRVKIFIGLYICLHVFLRLTDSLAVQSIVSRCFQLADNTCTQISQQFYLTPVLHSVKGAESISCHDACERG